MLQKSPGGSVFPYYYKGGEIHALKYGSFGNDGEKLLSLMDEETAFIRRRPASRLRVWVDFYETLITDNILMQLVHQIDVLQSQLIKLAVVGVSSRDKKRLCKYLRGYTPSITIPISFFEDPEDAKTWLVGEGSHI